MRGGLKIHQRKMGCTPTMNLNQRIGQPSETEEEVVLDEHHSDHSLHKTGSDVEYSEGERVENSEHPERTEIHSQQERVKWPASADKRAWQQFEDDVEQMLQNIACGSVDRKIETIATLIYAVGSERFGTRDMKTKTGKAVDKNRRTQEIGIIRQDFRRLTKRYKEVSEQERAGLQELRESLRERLKTLRMAENNRRKWKERERQRARFTANPFQYTSKLLGNKTSGRLDRPIKEVEEYLKKTHSDSRRNEDLGNCAKLIHPPQPSVAFDEKEPTLKEVQEIVKKSRAASAPGPNGVPYRVYMSCPKLVLRLWRLLRVVWRRGHVLRSWCTSGGCFIPKEEESTEVGHFRTISILNVEGKIFLSILSRRITAFMMANKYIDISVQKGGIPGVSGCVEHTSVLTQIIKEAKESKGNLVVLWLDLANAYGSIPHKLVETTLTRYHVPERFRLLRQDYYDNFKVRFSVNEETTEWQRLEVGIVTGCTVSVILFSAAMNLLIKSVEKMSREPTMATGVKQPPTRAFMDDMTVTAKSILEAKWMFQDLEEVIEWARMRFKPSKSRSLVLQRSKVKEVHFSMGQEQIPTVSEKPVKSLGKWFNDSLKDKDSVTEMSSKLTDWMNAVDKSGLPGKFKAWIYQHGVLPRLLWPLLVYEVPLTTVEGLVRKINGYNRRCLSVPRSFSSVGLYSTGTKLQMPLKSVTEEFKVTKVRQILMLRDSQDEKVSVADSIDKARRKKRTVRKGPQFVNFVKAGETEKSSRVETGVFATAGDWQMVADVKGRMQFPTMVASTTLRPDIVVWSGSSRQVVMLELTVPWEERMEEANERKKTKYQDLVEECQQRGWRTWCLPVEVGCRGFAGQSLWRALLVLGMVGRERKALVSGVSRQAEVASQLLWRKKNDQWMKPQ